MSVTLLAGELRDELAAIDDALQAIDVAGLLIPREFVAALQRARTVAALARQRSEGLYNAALADDGGAYMRKLVEWLMRDAGRNVGIAHEPGRVWSCTLDDPTRQATAPNCPGLGNAVEAALAAWTADAAREAEAQPDGWCWSE